MLLLIEIRDVQENSVFLLVALLGNVELVSKYVESAHEPGEL